MDPRDPVVSRASRSVTYAIQHFDRTGSMRAPYQVLRGFAAAGWEAKIATVSSEANSGITEAWSQVPVERVGRFGSRRFRIVLLTLRMLVRSRSQLAFSFIWDWHNYGLLLARTLLRRPFVVCLDTYCYKAPWDKKGWWARMLTYLRYGLVIRTADLVLAETPITAHFAAEIAREGRVRLIPFCLWRRDLVDVEQRWSAAQDSLERELVVLYAGRIVPRKNVHDLIEAFANVQPHHPEWRLEVMGPVTDSEYFQELEQQVAAHGLEDAVRFSPPCFGEELYRRLRTVSVFALPSAGEGLPTAITEAMFFGGAIVAGRSGSVGYQLANGGCGLLHEPGDVEGLAMQLEQLIDSKMLRNRLMAAARERMLELFTWEAYFPALEGDCSELVSSAS